jgi:DNA-binding PadR family transcriptional regulator
MKTEKSSKKVILKTRKTKKEKKIRVCFTITEKDKKLMQRLAKKFNDGNVSLFLREAIRKSSESGKKLVK